MSNSMCQSVIYRFCFDSHRQNDYIHARFSQIEHKQQWEKRKQHIKFQTSNKNQMIIIIILLNYYA